MSGTGESEDDFDALAGAAALGLLDEAERAAALAGRDARQFDAAMQDWELRLMPLATALPPVAPPETVWLAIAAATRPATVRRGLWDSLNFWRFFGLGAGALAAAALLVALLPRHPAPATNAVATLALQTGGDFIATAQQTGAAMRMVITPADVTVPSKKSAELWLLAPNHAPRALGLLASNTPVVMNITAEEAGGPFSAITLAVSLEPPGGSPTGLPTGPVIGSGKFSTF